MANFVIFHCERLKRSSSTPAVNTLHLPYKQLLVKVVWGKQSLMVLQIIRNTHTHTHTHTHIYICIYRSVDKSLARPGRKQATATEDFDVHTSYFC